MTETITKIPEALQKLANRRIRSIEAGNYVTLDQLREELNAGKGPKREDPPVSSPEPSRDPH